MKIITITGYKGGCGKSTTAIHLAAFLSEQGKTILVDGDPNETCLKWAERGDLQFEVVSQRKAVRAVQGKDWVVIDTPARPNSKDLVELCSGSDFTVLPIFPDILNLGPALETARDIGKAPHRFLVCASPSFPNKDGEQMRDDLKAEHIPVFEAIIRKTVGFPKAAMIGVALRDYPVATLREGWKDYEAFGKELLRELS